MAKIDELKRKYYAVEMLIGPQSSSSIAPVKGSGRSGYVSTDVFSDVELMAAEAVLAADKFIDEALVRLNWLINAVKQMSEATHQCYTAKGSNKCQICDRDLNYR